MKGLAAVMIATLMLSAPVIAVAQPAPPRTYSFTGLTEQDVQVLGSALGALPYRDVASLIAKLSQQAADQDKARQPAELPK